MDVQAKHSFTLDSPWNLFPHLEKVINTHSCFSSNWARVSVSA
jgi:hypothetical protein